jgi:hypothetical protein
MFIKDIELCSFKHVYVHIYTHRSAKISKYIIVYSIRIVQTENIIE